MKSLSAVCLVLVREPSHILIYCGLNYSTEVRASLGDASVLLTIFSQRTWRRFLCKKYCTSTQLPAAACSPTHREFHCCHLGHEKVEDIDFNWKQAEKQTRNANLQGKGTEEGGGKKKVSQRFTKYRSGSKTELSYPQQMKFLPHLPVFCNLSPQHCGTGSFLQPPKCYNFNNSKKKFYLPFWSHAW